VTRKAFDAPPALKSAAHSGSGTNAGSGVSEEAIVKAITDEVMRQMKS
jgi:hypothetical protein